MIKTIFRPFITISYLIQKAFSSDYSFVKRINISFVLVKLYLLSKIFTSKTEVSSRIFGFKMHAKSYSSLLFLFLEIFVTNDYKFISQKNDPLIYDCGSNIGMSIFYFKYLYPDCRIVSFEPNPFAFALLSKNIAENDFKNVQVHNIGLSKVEGEIEFFTPDNESSLVGSILKSRGGENSINITSKKFSSFLKDQKDIDLIKIDVEGAEEEVIDDLSISQHIQNSRNYIIEYHHKIGSTKSNLSKFLKYFEDTGFEYNLRTDFTNRDDFQDVLLNIYK